MLIGGARYRVVCADDPGCPEKPRQRTLCHADLSQTRRWEKKDMKKAGAMAGSDFTFSARSSDGSSEDGYQYHTIP